ncbi:hypothetical protein CXB51_033444 [Gossypium anomalum]|uniref:RHOMBOID-like protein n=1 Tax=Gossypium anomalum TaxID=47600 RepID=A0A8J5Y795_9ROSI|nr:hypothetical protein CXB51_033444 [Gossypium anomalum]
MGSWDPEKGSKGKKKKTDGSYECEKPWIPWLLPTIVLANIIIFVLMMYTNNVLRTIRDPRESVWLGILAGFLFSLPKKILSLVLRLIRNFHLFHLSICFLFTTNFRIGFGIDFSNIPSPHFSLEWISGEHYSGARFITCLWLHGGLIHLFANVLSFVFIGIRHEQQFGYVRVGVIYLLSGFGGSILSSLFMQHTTTVTAVITFIAIIVLNLAVGVLPHIDNFANIGGFFTGFLLGLVLLFRPQSGWIKPQHRPAGAAVISKHKPYQYVFCVIAVLLLIVGFGMGLLLVFKGANGNKHCSWCHHLTCAPTSKWPCGY